MARDSRGRFLPRGSAGAGGSSTGIRFDVREDSSGWKLLENVLKTLRDGGSYVKAGVVGEPAREAHPKVDAEGNEVGGPLTTAQLAAIHEFGTDTIPARPFILGTFELKRGEYLKLLRTTIVPAIYAARTSPAKGLEVLGHMMARDMRNRIVEGEGIPPPLAESTIKAKLRKGEWKGPDGGASDGAPRPLLDTGRMRNAITHEVVLADVGEGAE